MFLFCELLILGLSSIFKDGIWGRFGTSYDYWWLSFRATRCETVMTLRLCMGFWVSWAPQRCCLSEWQDFNEACEWNMYIYGGTKTNQDNVCFGFFPLAWIHRSKTFEEPIIMLWQKKVLVIFPKTDGRGILKKADLTHSSYYETHLCYLLPLLLFPNPCIAEMICSGIYLPAFLCR